MREQCEPRQKDYITICTEEQSAAWQTDFFRQQSVERGAKADMNSLGDCVFVPCGLQRILCCCHFADAFGYASYEAAAPTCSFDKISI